MATWIMHLRVAEKIKPFLGEIDEAAYYVGCIAPDSGTMVDNFTYLPSKDVSHWKNDDVSYEQRFEDNYAFFHTYGKGATDLRRRSFCLGYYVHLLTDTVYVRDIIHPYIHAHGKPFWRENIETIRAGWYELDFRFLCENKGYRPFSIISEVEDFPNDFLDYFRPNDITDRIKNAVELFSNSKVNENAVFLTIDKPRQEKLIEEMKEIIIFQLKKHNII